MAFDDSSPKTAALLIAHGSRRAEANRDLADLADTLRTGGTYPIVEIAYLELAEPTISAAGCVCVERGAALVLMLPYFLSAGAHVVEDLERFRRALADRYPGTRFSLCKPLSPHPLLREVILDRLREAEDGKNAQN
jgi:sirohydrochlorin ferrochelatase